MPSKKTFYLVYELPAENITQAKAVAVEMNHLTGTVPVGLFEKTDFNLPGFIAEIKQENPKG